ncbi:type VI secretion system Vgr family protein [Labrys portucalensis]|uniref:Type VI secretion system Vgr family protein n=1 Tax=Labrys neptuniae TaxID=376174 RepID=A0ABV6ZP24_9HYPH
MELLDAASAGYIQAGRILRIETPLGADVLLPEHMEMREAINDLFTLTIAVRSKKTDIKPDEIVGKLVDVSLELGQGERRTWNGLVVRLGEGPAVTRGLRAYTLELRPQHWLLSQKSDCRIWMDKTSLDVARTLLSEHKLIAPVTSGVIPEPKPQHYSVQYNETDLAYLIRRLEEDGLFYWFVHTGGEVGSVSAKHVMHIASHASGYTTGSEPDVRYALGSTDRNHLTRLERSFHYIPGKRSAGDWNFLTPSTTPAGQTPSLISLPGNEAYELYEYPMVGGYGSDSASEGIANDRVERQSKLRMQAAEADYERIEGASSIRTLAPGQRFKPYDVANPGNSFEEHITFQIIHTARDRSYETNEGDPEYSNRFIALPSRVPATPHRTTPRPRIDGTDIAIIAGPPGEEIHPDKYGRVKAYFPWDRRAKKDGTDTCWIRVAQSWGGGTWGSQIVPRIGMEAIVSYLGGDPDRPVITALVPNERNQVPYELPANKTRSTFRSNSHKSTGFNEFTMEDKTGGENMFFHAQKDHTTRVLNNRTARIDSHDVHSVGGSRAVEVANNQKHEIGGSYHLTVGGTGAGALGALAGVAGLAGQTASLLQQAGQIAGGGGPELASFAMSVGSSALGFLSGGGLSARDGVVSGPSPRADAGTALAGAGTGVGQDVGGLFSLPGMMYTVAGTYKLDSIGMARAEQIGLSKVTHVGASFVTHVGKAHALKVGETSKVEIGKAQKLEVGEAFETKVGKTNVIDVGQSFEIKVGEKFVITVGKTRFQMDKSGIVTIEAPSMTIVKGGGAQLTVGPGPILYVPTLVPGAVPSPPAQCLRRMAANSSPFVVF